MAVTTNITPRHGLVALAIHRLCMGGQYHSVIRDFEVLVLEIGQAASGIVCK